MTTSAAQELASVIGLDLANQHVIAFTIRARTNGTTVTVMRHLPRIGKTTKRFELSLVNQEAQASPTPPSSTKPEGGQK